MRLAALLALGALVAGCGESDPMAQSNDLVPKHPLAAVSDFPTEAEIEAACEGASARFKEEAEKTPGTYVDPIIGFSFPVRNPDCRWEAASTALCRFDVTMVSWDLTDEQRAEAVRRTRDEDWEPHQARLVYVSRVGPDQWIAPSGCQATPRS